MGEKEVGRKVGGIYKVDGVKIQRVLMVSLKFHGVTTHC